MKKARKIIKRIFLLVFVLIVLLVGAAVAIPYFFKDELLAKVKEEANKSLNAKVDFSDLNLSLLRQFPDLSIRLDDFSLMGIGSFEGVPLTKARSILLTVDLLSAMQTEEPAVVKGIYLEEPLVNILVTEEGAANYDIAKADTTSTIAPEDEAATAFSVQLKEYSISGGNFIYEDKSGGIFAEIKGLDHSGSGAFTQDQFDLNTRTLINSLSVRSGGVSYLRKAQLSLVAVLGVNVPTMTITLKENDLRLNDLQLLADGSLQSENDDLNLDLSLKAPGNNFKSLLSLIPYAYTQDYQDVKADGNFSLAAMVKGTYNGVTGQLPAFSADLAVDNASFKYPDLPLGMKDIRVKAKVDSPSSDLDKLTVNVPILAFKLGDNPFALRLDLKTPMSDPAMDAQMKGVLDLEDLINAFPVEGVNQLKGIVNADASLNTRMSVLEKEDYEQVDVKGKVNMKDFVYEGDGLPVVSMSKAEIEFTPSRILFPEITAQLGRSDISASGQIDNLLAYFSPEKTMTGKLLVRSRFFDANEWMPEEEATEMPAGDEELSYGAAGEEVFDRFSFALDAAIQKLVYADYELKNVLAKGAITPERLDLDAFEMEIGNSDIQATGQATNLFGYAFGDETLKGNFVLNSDFMDLNQFMVETEAEESPQATPISYEEEDLEPMAIPDRMDITLDARMKKVVYTNMNLEDLRGQVKVKDQKASLNGVEASTMGGKIGFEGSYDTQKPEEPAFDMKTTIRNMDFQEAFNTLNTFQAVAPIGKYITGNFSTDLSLNGLLGPDLMPKLESLDAKGFLQTINSVVKNYKPLNEVGSKLNIKELNNFQLKNTKNWFEIRDGRVIVEPFDEQIKDIALNIGGSHIITGGMDYVIKAKVPSKYVKNAPGGSVLQSAMGQLGAQAKKLGLPFKEPEFLNFNIQLKGSLDDPKVGVKFVGADGESSGGDLVKESVKELADKAKDSLRNRATEEVDKVKEEATEKVEEVVDDAKQRAEEARKKAEEEAKKRAEEAKRKAEERKKKMEEEAKKQAEEAKRKAEEEAKKKLEELNPFKKKKGGG
jgi:hypothetical protein